MKMLKRSRLMNNDQEVPPEVAEFAPKRVPAVVPSPTYLTAEMIAPQGKVGDPMRLAEVTAPAVEKIGISSATHIEEVALAIVEHAKATAQELVDDAHRQAEKMVHDAEAVATYMQGFATDVRTYSMAKSAQVASFCSIATSVMGSMHSLNEHFSTNRRDETVRAREQPDEEPLELPHFMKPKAKT